MRLASGNLSCVYNRVDRVGCFSALRNCIVNCPHVQQIAGKSDSILPADVIVYSEQPCLKGRPDGAEVCLKAPAKNKLWIIAKASLNVRRHPPLPIHIGVRIKVLQPQSLGFVGEEEESRYAEIEIHPPLVVLPRYHEKKPTKTQEHGFLDDRPVSYQGTVNSEVQFATCEFTAWFFKNGSRRTTKMGMGALVLTVPPGESTGIKTVVNIDLRAYRKISEHVKTKDGIDALVGLDHQITSFIVDAMSQIKPESFFVIRSTGDGAIVRFDSAKQAFDFAYRVMENARLYNEGKEEPYDFRLFHCGIATGEIRECWNKYGVFEPSGTPFADVDRLMTFAKGGEVVLDQITYDLIKETIPNLNIEPRMIRTKERQEIRGFIVPGTEADLAKDSVLSGR